MGLAAATAFKFIKVEKPRGEGAELSVLTLHLVLEREDRRKGASLKASWGYSEISGSDGLAARRTVGASAGIHT